MVPKSFVMLSWHGFLLARLPPCISDRAPVHLLVFNTSTCLSLNREESAFPTRQQEQNQTDESQIPTRIDCGRGNLGKKSPCFQIQTYHMSTVKGRIFYLTPLRMAIIKKCTNNKCWRRYGEKGILLHCWWECKWVQPLWRTVRRLLKKLKIELPFLTEQSHSWAYTWRKPNHNSKRYMHTNVLCSTIYNSQDLAAT